MLRLLLVVLWLPLWSGWSHLLVAPQGAGDPATLSTQQHPFPVDWVLPSC